MRRYGRAKAAFNMEDKMIASHVIKIYRHPRLKADITQTCECPKGRAT